MNILPSPNLASTPGAATALRRARLALAGALLVTALAPSARAQGAPAPAGPAADAWGLTVPQWISSASVAVRQGSDSNLYGVSNNLAGHPAIANVSSAFTTLSAGFTLDLLAASGPQGAGFVKTLSLAYAADYTAYAAAAREDNLRNTFTLEAAGDGGPWSFSVDNTLLYVDGSREDAFFNQYNNLGYGSTRERRNQIQENNRSFLRYDAKDWFLRALDNATTYNLLIDEHNPVGAYKGYANWVNRDDLNAGLDLGFKATPDLAFFAGWRLGQQTQAQLYYNPAASDSTYNRALVGFEGSAAKWLKAELVGGPDFRRYSDAGHLGLTGDRHTWLYLRGQLTATFTPEDTLTASERVWHFVSSAGVYSIQETAESLLYRHAFSKELSASAGLRVIGHRYDAPTVRNDWTESVPVDVTYAFTRGLSVSADYSATTGRSHLPVASTPGQNFEDNLASVSLKATF